MKFFNYLATLFSLLFIYIGSIDKTIAAEFRGLGELQDGVFRSSKDVSADGSTFYQSYFPPNCSRVLTQVFES